MILKSIKLENIRSYLNEEIIFPEGSVLLCGDIGTGKSTVLLAIEFAFFGIIKGTISGNTLLRYGKKEGSVELRFEIDRKEMIIKRKLKRGKTAIAQTSGYIIKDGIKKEGTAVELKSWILEILGYPKELLTKSKSLIYRYTVYTPQEEMKTILFEDKEARLDTLRKVFGIDKYKRIRENSMVYLKELKTRAREFAAMISDLEEKKEARDRKEEGRIEKKTLMSGKGEELKGIKEEAGIIKAKLDEFEHHVKQIEQRRKEFDMNALELRQKIEMRKGFREDSRLLEGKNEEIEGFLIKSEIEELKEINLEQIKKEIAETNRLLQDSEKEIMNINNIKSSLKTKIEHSESIKNKIQSMDSCPLCLQKVDSEHKKGITIKENENIGECKTRFLTCTEKARILQEKVFSFKKNAEILMKKESNNAMINIRIKELKENKEKLKKIIDGNKKIKEDIGKINLKNAEISKQITEMKDIEKEYKQINEEFEKITLIERKKAIGYAEIKKEVEGIESLIKGLDEEIKKKEEIKKDLLSAKELIEWIEKIFINLMNVMEKHVMMKVYHEFNDLFVKWFSVLIEDELLSVRLDDEFTPIVIQNGYEGDIEHLSGGEKTSLALAYRLSLNKIINDLMDTIKTKELIILDEPTDGFSTEQLDKIRDVLDQLNIKQIVIVSHESKIESFVDNVVRIVKNDHVSNII